MAIKKKSAENQLSIEDTDEAWDDGTLGRSAEHAVRSKLKCEDLDEMLEMQSISIRLPKSLIEDFKLIAGYHGNNYQPLMRQILKRFAAAEIKTILREVADVRQGRAEGSDNVVRSKRPKKKAA
jgi:predicted DNA binding CopG/RHH family protein